MEDTLRGLLGDDGEDLDPTSFGHREIDELEDEDFEDGEEFDPDDFEDNDVDDPDEECLEDCEDDELEDYDDEYDDFN